jgi:hypothetical protein
MRGAPEVADQRNVKKHSTKKAELSSDKVRANRRGVSKT